MIRKNYLTVGLFTLLSLFLRGYDFGKGDQLHYLTFVKFKLHPSLYPLDFLLQKHNVDYTIFIEALRLLPANLAEQSVVYFVIYIVFLYFFYLTIFRLSLILFHDKKTAWFALMAFIPSIPIGGSSIVTLEKSFILRFAATVGLLLSIVLLIKKKIVLSGSSAGISFLIHPLTLLPYLPIAFMLTLVKYLTKSECIRIFFIFFLVSFPIITQFFQNSHDSFFMDDVWRAIVTERMPYNFALQWSGISWLVALFFLFLFFFSMSNLPKREENKVILVIVYTSFSFLMANILSDIFSFRIGLQLQLTRNLYLAVVFILISFAHVVRLNITSIKMISSTLFFYSLLIVLMLKNRSFDNPHWFPRTDYEQLAAWARDHTPYNSLFLTPPMRTGFRFFSERSVVTEYKEGAESLYSRQFAIEWSERQSKVKKYYADESDENLIELKKEFPLSYVVSGSDLRLKKIYQEGEWKIYDIQ